MYAERGDWDRALETASEHGNDVLHKYVALCATQKIKDGRPGEALQVLLAFYSLNYSQYVCNLFAVVIQEIWSTRLSSKLQYLQKNCCGYVWNLYIGG